METAHNVSGAKVTGSVPDPLARLLYTYCDVNALGDRFPEELRLVLEAPEHPRRGEMFRQQLADAILRRTVTPAQYESLTGHDFDTPEDLEKWLRELWQGLYGDQPVR